MFVLSVLYINQTGDEPQKQDTQANKRSPLLSEEVPYQITLIRLRQGSLDRRRIGRKSSGRCSRRMTATRLRTWKVRADRRNVVMDEVAHDVSCWASEKGTKRLVCLRMSLMRV